MKSISKLQNLIKPENEVHIRDLCEWIRANCHHRITWNDLIAQSGFSHKDLITLFGTYMKTTPMAFVRHCQSASFKSDSIQQPLFLEDPPRDG